MNEKLMTTINFFKEAATEGNGPICYSDDYAFKMAKEYSILLDKLTKYACYEVCPYIIGKVPREDESYVVTEAAKKIIRGAASYAKNEKSDSKHSRESLVKVNAKWAVCDYWRKNYRKMTLEEREDYIKTLPKDYIREIINSKTKENTTIRKNSNNLSFEEMAGFETDVADFQTIQTEDEKIYLRAYLIALLHTLFSLDFAPYKLLTYFYKSTVVAELKKKNGGLCEYDEDNEDIGALSKLEGRTLGSIFDDLPYVIETYMNLENHLTEWEIHLILDPINDKLENYGRLVNNRATILHYNKIKDAVEDMSKIKTQLRKQENVINELRERIYTKLSRNVMFLNRNRQ